jgi:hypothetical protein
MTFEIFMAFPPDHETPIAELWVHHDGVVDIPAQICRESDGLKIKIFGREGGVVWEYFLEEWVEGVRRAVKCLGEGQSRQGIRCVRDNEAVLWLWAFAHPESSRRRGAGVRRWASDRWP